MNTKFWTILIAAQVGGEKEWVSGNCINNKINSLTFSRHKATYQSVICSEDSCVVLHKASMYDARISFSHFASILFSLLSCSQTLVCSVLSSAVSSFVLVIQKTFACTHTHTHTLALTSCSIDHNRIEVLT